jgi:hypothetical protein
MPPVRRARWKKLARLLRTKQQLAWLCEMPPTRGYPHRLKGRHESPNFRKPFYLVEPHRHLGPTSRSQ